VEPVVGAEQVLERCVVHVDAVLAREVDPHGAERVERAGILLEAVVDRLLEYQLTCDGGSSVPRWSKMRMLYLVR